MGELAKRTGEHFGDRAWALNGRLASHQIAFHTVVTFLFALVMFFVGRVCYFKGDDYLLATLVTDSFGEGTGTSINLFVSIILLWPLNLLSRATGFFNVYGCTLFLSLALVFVELHLIAVRLGAGTAWHVFLYLLECLVSFFVTFTVFAYLLCGSALLLAYSYVATGEPVRGGWVLPLISLVLGIALRREVVPTVLFLHLPLLLGSCPDVTKRMGGAFVIAGLLFVAILVVDSIYIGMSPIRSQHALWNAASASVRDYPALDYERYKDVATSLGWSRNDYSMLYTWAFIDKLVFSTNKLRELAARAAFADRYALSPLAWLASARDPLIAFAPMLLFLGLPALLDRRRAHRDRLGVAMSIVTPLVLLWGLAVRQRVVWRVTLPLFMLAYAQTYMLSSPHEGRKCGMSRMPAVPCAVLAGTCLVWALPTGIVRSYAVSPYTEVTRYVQSHDETFFIVDGPVLDRMVSLPIVTMSNEICEPPNAVRMGDWDAFSLSYYRRLERFGIDRPDEGFRALVESDDVRLVVADARRLEQIVTFLNEHYGWDPAPRLCAEFDGISVYDLSGGRQGPS